MTVKRSSKRRPRPPLGRLALAGRLYDECASARGPVDRVTARFLREHKALDDEARGFVVRTAAGMLRHRRWLERAAEELPFRAPGGALAALYLVGREGVGAASLELDDKSARAMRFAAKKADEAPLAVRASLPDWLAERLLEERGDDDGTRLCLALGDAPPPTLRANTLKTTRAGLLAALAAEGIAARPAALAPHAVVVESPARLFRSHAFHGGLFEMQDESSQLASLLVEARPGQLVVDGCAGAGGKTLALAAAMENKGRLYAFDVAAFRLDDLKKRARRAGVHNLRVHALSSLGDPHLLRLKGKADAVLVDAPCSGTGVLRRNPDISWKLSPDDVVHMTLEQGALLDRYARLVKKGGRLVYATCSLLDDEDERQVEAFLARAPSFALVHAKEALARQGVSLDGASPYLRLFPHRHGTDGFFAAVLERRS